jgi:hypothetical protein
MATTRALLNQEEYEALRSHLRKHKLYPFSYSIRKLISAANFPTADGGGIVKYFTLSFTPEQAMGVVSLATNLVITPETTFGIMGLQMSYKPTLSLADNTVATSPNNEGNNAYNLILNGGAINDFQVFFPLNFYLESRQTIYIHVFANNAVVAAASSNMTGQIILGTLPLTN